LRTDLPPTDAGQSWIHESEFEYRASDLARCVYCEEQYRTASTFSPPPISMKRLLAGYGQERGTIGIEVVNNLDAPVDAVYVESWPWWLKTPCGLTAAQRHHSDLDGARALLWQRFQHAHEVRAAR
jgi:hypothetical protein